MKKSFLLTVGLIALYNLFFFRTEIGIGLGLISLLVNTCFYFSRDKAAKNTNLGIFSSVLGIVFAFLIGFRNNGIVQLFDFMAASFFSIVALSFFKNPNTFSYFIPSFLSKPLSMTLNYFISLGSLFRVETLEEKKTENKSPVGSIIRGLVVTIPIFLVLLFLLIQADPAFNKLVSDLFRDLWQRLIFSVLIFFALYPSLQIKLKEKIDVQLEKSIKNVSHKSYELMIITGSIIVLFGSFIAVQFHYLFSTVGERELQKLGINSLTYSEYINKGFFELLVVSAIACLILIYNLRHIHGLKGIHKTLTQLFTSILTIETALIILSDFKRIILYADAHGLTRARIFGFIFLIWLTLILGLFLVSIIKQLPKKYFFSSSLVITVLILLTTNILNIDNLIASTYKPTVNNEIDYYYSTRLSADAYPSWSESFQYSKNIIAQYSSRKDLNHEEQRQIFYARQTFNALYYRVRELRFKFDSEEVMKQKNKEEFADFKDKPEIPPYLYRTRDWSNFNLSQYQAYLSLKDNPELYNIHQLKATFDKTQSFINPNNYFPVDRDTSPPLTK